MSTIEHSATISREWNGTLMTPEEFDAATDWDEEYFYELINGLLIVTPYPSAGERGMNDVLAQRLLNFRDQVPEGLHLNVTLPGHTLATGDNRRRADRVTWCGLDDDPDVMRDVPQVVVEMVSADRRDRRRDYETKRNEYSQIGVLEYWIIDRFQRRVTVVRFSESGETETLLTEANVLTTPLLPGLEIPLARLFATADRLAPRRTDD
jgi:Uma2 family endonuclease